MLKRLITALNVNSSSVRGSILKRWEGTGTKVIMAEESLATSLRSRFPKATYIQVNDVSGGCGAMFEVTIEAPDFKGLSVVKQHRLVTGALSEQIKDMHGIRIQTTASPEE